MFFTAISIAIILRNNTPLGPVCWLLQHTVVAPVGSAPRNWPPKPRFMILLPLPLLQPSPISYPARAGQFRMTKSHVLHINYLSAWTQHSVDVCQLIASSFMLTRKSQTTLQGRLELTTEGLTAGLANPSMLTFPAFLTGYACKGIPLQSTLGTPSDTL